MTVYRLSRARYAKDLSGKGAEIAGGRWNSRGVAMIYTGQSRALCTTEIAVHTPLGNIPLNYMLVTISLPEDSVFKLKLKDLPTDWKAFPHAHSTQQIGDRFVADGKFLAMEVPSAVVQGDSNFLINPQHKDFKKVRILEVEPFDFDERLFRR